MYTKFVHRTVLIALLALVYPATSFAGFVGIGASVGFAPPPLPVYVQPPCPAPGYIWTPGHWAYSYDAGGYYWVPGTWVLAPVFGLLWTPGYWGLVGAEFVWHEGYWGPHVGFYGGINYGFGYFGSGFVGGYWWGHNFYYNRAVTNVSNVNVTNVYNRPAANNHYGSRPSFNGPNGVQARPTHDDLVAAREPHRALTAPQRAQAAAARYANRTSAPSSHPSLADRSRGLSSNRDTAPYSASRNTRSQSSAAPQYRSSSLHEQHVTTASSARHGGIAPSTMRTPAAESRTSSARWSPPPSYRPAQPNRTNHYSPPPSRPASAQPPRNAAAFPKTSQPPHADHEAAPRGERRS